jgi:hypothetical protein
MKIASAGKPLTAAFGGKKTAFKGGSTSRNMRQLQRNMYLFLFKRVAYSNYRLNA